MVGAGHVYAFTFAATIIPVVIAAVAITMVIFPTIIIALGIARAVFDAFKGIVATCVSLDENTLHDIEQITVVIEGLNQLGA